jgi:hypothetical protein
MSQFSGQAGGGAAGGGTVTSVSGTANQIASTGGNTPVLSLATAITLPGTIVMPGSANKTGQASATTTSGSINTSETIVLVTSTAIGAARLAVGTTIRCTLNGNCTASAANASHVRIRIGTAGALADTAVFDVTTPVSAASGTNIPFRMILEMTMRTIGSGTSATAVGQYTVINQGITGIGTVAANTAVASMSGFDSTANNFLSATYLSAAATTTCVFTQGFFEIVYN